MDFTDKTAVITGASRGLGAGLATAFSRRGLRLGLCSRAAPALPASDRVVAARLDVTDERAIAAFADEVARRFGRIDLWINNAGVLAPIDPVRDVSAADFRRHLDVNVTGVFLGTRAYVRHLRATDSAGVLVNVSSGAARLPQAGLAAYCAGKAAVNLLTSCVQLEEGDRLRAYAVTPGVIDTDMQALARSCTPSRFPAVDMFRQLQRDNAFSTTEHVARELLALAFAPRPRPPDTFVALPPGK